MEEDPHFYRRSGRIAEDYTRFNQIGKANGYISAGNQRIEITDWWACRDHSWGVRPNIGGIREPEGPGENAKSRDFVFSFLFFSTQRVAGYLQIRLDGGAGNYFSAALIDRATGNPISMKHFSLRADLVPGTKRFAALHVTLQPAAGEPLHLVVRQIANGVVMPGLGYSGGWNDRRGLGAWRGEYHRESDVWDISDPELVGTGSAKKWRPLHRIYPVSVESSDGSSGTGSQTWLMTGEIPGLTTSGVGSEEKQR
jgi:hypothetical protein